MTADGPTVVVVGAGYEGKRRYYERLAALGARLVIVDEPGHWSETLAQQIAGTQWVAVPISGDPDADRGQRPDGRREDPPDGRGGVGRRPHRSPASQLP